jgi:predicted alpha/beta superfamily hydrolase
MQMLLRCKGHHTQLRQMNIAGKNINIFGAGDKAAPIVYLHTFQQEGSRVWEECRKMGTRRFVLVEIDGVDWNADMSPWPIEKLFAGDTACTGGAEAWLEVLTEQIIPEVEKDLNVTRRYLAGYSLAGLFALWAAYTTPMSSVESSPARALSGIRESRIMSAKSRWRGLRSPFISRWATGRAT